MDLFSFAGLSGLLALAILVWGEAWLPSHLPRQGTRSKRVRHRTP